MPDTALPTAAPLAFPASTADANIASSSKQEDPHWLERPGLEEASSLASKDKEEFIHLLRDQEIDLIYGEINVEEYVQYGNEKYVRSKAFELSVPRRLYDYRRMFIEVRWTQTSSYDVSVILVFKDDEIESYFRRGRMMFRKQIGLRL